MQLSLKLTEEREIASGRKRPGKPVPPHVTPKQKALPRVPSAPAEISKPKKQKLDVDVAPQKLKEEKPNVKSSQEPKKAKRKAKSKQKPPQKRPLPNEDTKSETSPSKKKAKKDDAITQRDWITKSNNAKVGNSLDKSGKSKNKAGRDKKQTVNSGKPKDSGLKTNKKRSKKQAKKVPKDDGMIY